MTSPSTNLKELDANSKTTLFEFLDAAPIAMLATTKKGDIKKANHAATALLGYQKNQLESMNLNEIITAEVNGADSISTTAAGHRLPIRLQKKTTQLGDIPTVICTIVDISQESQLRKKTQEITLELQKSREQIGAFISVASHDLKSPLRRSKSFLDLLSKNYQPLFDEQGQDWLNRCTKNLDHMQSLISDLAIFAGIDAKTASPTLCNLQDIAAREFSKLKENDHPNAKINFTAELPRINGDSQLLALLFNNLFENSLAYNDSEIPAVDIQCSLAGEKWEIRIADNGLGIEKKFRDSIFDFFKRLHSSQRYPGNGLGLAISQRIALHHSGSLTLAAEQPDQGTVFLLTFPLA